jgi:phosphonate transport system substrate-binding protein
MGVSKQILLVITTTLVAVIGLGVRIVSGVGSDSNFNQYVHGFVPQNRQITNLTVVLPCRGNPTDLKHQANALAMFLSQELGISVEALTTDNTDAVEALRKNQADVALLGSSAALKAEQFANAHMYLAEVHPGFSGRYTYRSVLVVRNNSSLTAKASAKATLEQLEGKKIAFTSPISSSGFIFPVDELMKQRLVANRQSLDHYFSQVTYENNYGGALLAVLHGEADVASVAEYSLRAPYIIAEQAKQLRVIYSIPGVPAHGIVIDDDVPAELRERIINALLELNQPENNHLLRHLNNTTRLVRVEHNHHLEPARLALKRVRIES